MKYACLLGIVLWIGFSATCQPREKLKKDKFNSSKFETYTVEVKKKWFDSLEVKFPFSISFIDARADTGKLGFIRAGNDNSFFNMAFPEKSSSYLNSSITRFSKAVNNNDRLFVVIRHLWMSQLIVKADLSKALFTAAQKPEFLSYCYLNAEYYFGNSNEAKHIGNLDTLFRIKKWIGNVTDDLIKEALTTILSEGDTLLAVKNTGLKNLSGRQFFDTICRPFNCPILEASNPQKGIYLNYDQFLKNTPSIGEFEIRKNKDETYIFSGSVDNALTKDAWGYSNGIDVFMHINDDYYKMIRVQNTYELAGPRKVNRLYTGKEAFLHILESRILGGIVKGGVSVMLVLSDESMMRELVPYQLNMKEGTLY